MDITETFRNEDISKTDFFDFVVTPDMTESQSTLSFNKTLKSMGIFIDSNDVSNNQNNSNHTAASYHEVKETNNNNLLLSTSSTSGVESTILGGVVSSFIDNSFWSSGTCDKDAVRLETAILEDLNKFCWNQEQVPSSESESSPKNIVNLNSTSNNDDTDGAIYTLTVLNGGESNPTWYRIPPEPASGIKEEIQLSHHQDISSPHNVSDNQSATQHIKQEHSTTSSLDLDSILNIIPNHGHNLNGHQGYLNGYHTPSLDPNDVSVKNEQQYSYGNEDCENELRHIMNTTTTVEVQDSCNYNNNNDWKITNNNNNHDDSAKSLLRSALQGKSFVSRYTNSPKSGNSSDILKISDDQNSELRHVLSTPPGSKTPLDQSPVFLSSVDTDDCERKHSPMMSSGYEISASVSFDDSGDGRVFGIVDSDNPSSTHSMEDILLSHLNVATYAEDYEKLRLIANEVAESANQYCSIGTGGYVSPHLTPPDGHLSHSMLSPLHRHHHQLSPLISINPLPSSNKTGNKKFGKAKTSAAKNSHGNSMQANGIRKERSLHYCSICSKGFKDKYSVNVHIRTHTGEKPFACTLCGKSFRQKAHLAKHYQTHIAQKSAAASVNATGKHSSNKSRFNNATKSS